MANTIQERGMSRALLSPTGQELARTTEALESLKSLGWKSIWTVYVVPATMVPPREGEKWDGNEVIEEYGIVAKKEKHVEEFVKALIARELDVDVRDTQLVVECNFA